MIVVLMFEAVSLETVHPGSHRPLRRGRSALGERYVSLGPVRAGAFFTLSD